MMCLAQRGWVLLLIASPILLRADDGPIHSDSDHARLRLSLEVREGELNQSIRERPGDFDLYSARGDVRFFLGDFAAAIDDYEQMVTLRPEVDASHWRRGIALFYAGRYEDAARQFERYHTFDQVDRENGIWRYLSVFKADGAEAANQSLLKYEKDDREPFPDVYRLFAGTMTSDEVLSRIESASLADSERQKRLFYAHLYIGLLQAVQGHDASAKSYLSQAVANDWPRPAWYGPEYMWHVARLHEELLSNVQAEALEAISPPPVALMLNPFYQKCILVEEFPIVASEKVHDAALREAAWVVRSMLQHRPDLLEALHKSGTRLAVMACDELTTQIPEHSDLTPRNYWDRRARGLGATRIRPAVSCGEENLLQYPGDPYSTENILVHEFAHVIHQMGLSQADETFDDRLKDVFKQAQEDGLWTGTYALSNHSEYWAEGVQSYFDTNRANDNQHNHVDTQEELREYDPRLFALIDEAFRQNEWRYSWPRDRDESGRAHLVGYDPSQAPTFRWPEHLRDVDLRKPE